MNDVTFADSHEVPSKMWVLQVRFYGEMSWLRWPNSGILRERASVDVHEGALLQILNPLRSHSPRFDPQHNFLNTLRSSVTKKKQSAEGEKLNGIARRCEI